MELYTKTQNELINAKTEVKNIKRSGNIPILLKKK